jgi:hypothetical protein
VSRSIHAMAAARPESRRERVAFTARGAEKDKFDFEAGGDRELIQQQR